MNREQKIALILGFAVILVVGVLVSDHWSRARELELADATEGDGGFVQQTPIAALPGPREVTLAPFEPPQAEPAWAAKTDPVDEPLPQEIVRIDQGSGETRSPLSEMLEQAGPAVALDSSGGGGFLSELGRAGERIVQELGALPEAARLERERVPQIGARPAKAESDEPGATPTRRVRHTVAKNESLFAIAKRYYGDGNKWRLIKDANPTKVDANGGVRQGVTLEIPADVDGAAPRPPKPSGQATPPRPTLSEPISYTVKKNDSLSEIAQRFLGSARRMSEIIAANRGKISDPDDIRVGMVLTIPARN